MTRHLLLAACAATAIITATPAFAQDAGAPATTPAEAPEEDMNSGDIVVTAQGRAQALADVPLAVSAINAEALERSGASDIRQLAQIAPSLLVSSTGNEANGSARLRGIGTVGDNPGLESSVAVFVDGVYRSRSGIGLNELGDIERVEVLRGPQGTLFGRNASAGIISIISKSPNLNAFSGGGEATYGNYDFYRFAGNLNVPLGDTVAARLDGVYVKRDGFYNDLTNDVTINDRDRYFLRGQVLFEPNEDLTVRLIGDYTKRNESCCAAAYIDGSVTPENRNLLSNLNPIIPVLKSLGLPEAALRNPYSRDIYVSPGRTYDGETQDWGVSAQIDYDLGGARLTSISAYREYYNFQAGDVDYGFVDILYRAPGDDAGRRQFKTITQELRLQGSAFDEKLDWLIGGFYGNEELETRENLRFGSQYGRFASCRLLTSIGQPALAAIGAGSTGCLGAVGRGALLGANGGAGAFGAATAPLIAGFDRLDTVNNVGDTGSRYRVKSENFAFFTHNIFHIAEGFDLTLGLRYTNETKKLDTRFANNNTVCQAQQAALTPLLTSAVGAVAGGLISLACQGNSTAELNGLSVNGQRKEDEFTGTGILSYKVTPDLLVYGSYARGYKAGGFNLDRSALKNPIQTVNGVPTTTFAAAGGVHALAANLQFLPEINNAFEIGAKYSTREFSINIAGFRQAFQNFQLNTFNGTVFLVQNVNSCKSELNGGDRDLSATTGRCAADDVQAGVISQGVEVESTFSPARNFTVGAGITYAQTKFRDNLVGTDAGAPLDPALRLLPDSYLSNAPATTVTSSVTWTPELGSSGFSALFYLDGRLTSDFNTGSDKFPQKKQDGFFVANARVGLRAPESRFSIELWAQNLFDVNYTQIGFNTPFQAAQGVGGNPNFPAAQYPGGTQVFSAFLAEPRTYGITLRGKF